METKLEKVIETLKDYIYEEVIKIIIERTNLTKNSDLIKSVEVYTSNEGYINIGMNDYGKYLDRGRLPGLKKIPYNFLLKWVVKNNIDFGKGHRTTAYMIQNSIKRKGIKPRKFLDAIQKEVENVVGRIGERELEDELNRSLEDLFLI